MSGVLPSRGTNVFKVCTIRGSPVAVTYVSCISIRSRVRINSKYTRVGETKLRVHQVSAFMIQNQGEEMIWFFTQDITDVIKNRDELRELNYLMDAILNNIPVYLFVKDPEDDFLALILNHKGRNLMNTKFCFSHTGIFGTISKITSVVANLLNTFIKLFFSIQGNRQIIDFLCS